MRQWIRAGGQLLIGTAVVAGNGHVGAESIWDHREPHIAFLFQDNRAHNVGDVVTILVSEDTETNQQDQRDLAKSSSFETLFNFKGSSSAGSNVSRSGAANMDISGSTNRKFDGSSQLKSSHTFTDKLTVTVVDVLPNGNLVLQGYRTRLVSGEMRTLRVTGVVRAADVDTSNSVSSQVVANFQVTYVGKGPETNFSRQGYFGRAMNILWPF